MHTIRLTPGGAIRKNAPSSRMKRTSEERPLFGFNTAEAAMASKSILLSSAVPFDMPHLGAEQSIVKHGRICLDELEQWRRRWLLHGVDQLDDLVRIQRTLNREKPTSPKLQSLLEEMNILIAVEIAKRSRRNSV